MVGREYKGLGGRVKLVLKRTLVRRRVGRYIILGGAIGQNQAWKEFFVIGGNTAGK